MASFADIQLDAEVTDGLSRGDTQAQTAVYRAVAPTVMGLAVRILRDSSLAQEVVQDTFVELLEHGHRLTEPASVVGWLRKVAVNHCLMRLRSPWMQRRSGAEPQDNTDGFAAHEQMQASPDIEQALGHLSPETRMVVWLHDVEGYTHKEIGSLMNKSTSYSKSQLSRGYDKLMVLYHDNSTAGTNDRQGLENDDKRKHIPTQPACSP